MVKLGGFLPSTFGMATAAFVPQRFFVFVVFFVAKVTVLARFDFVNWIDVAFTAGSGSVFSAKRVACLGVVIEVRRLP